MANTKKATKEASTENTVNSEENLESEVLVSYPESSAEYTTLTTYSPYDYLCESDLWIKVNGDENTHVMDVTNGVVIMKNVGNNFSLCYVPNIVYKDGKFKRI